MANPGVALNPSVAPPFDGYFARQLGLKSPIRWNWNVSFQRELPFRLNVHPRICRRRRFPATGACVRHQPKPVVGVLQANPGKNANYLPVPTWGLQPFSRSRATAVQVITPCKSVGTGSLFLTTSRLGVSETWARSMDDIRTVATSFPTHTTRLTFWGPSEYDARWCGSRKLPLFPAALPELGMT